MNPEKLEKGSLSPEQETIAQLREENAILRDKLRDRDSKVATLTEIINTDVITKLRSRRATEEKMSSIDERRRTENGGAAETESKKRVAILMLDIDHFKSINDTYGHPFGDKVLREVGAFLKETFRKDDFIGRWGGEEFMVLLKAPDLELLMNKFYDPTTKQARLGHEFEIDGKKLEITFSGGITELEPDEDLDGAVSRADEALYVAKKESEGEGGEKIPGRNRILPYTPQMQTKKGPASEMSETDTLLERERA